MQWAVTLETERGQNMIFVMGPVFYSPPVETQIRTALRPYTSSRQEAGWVSELVAHLPNMPVIPYAIFIRHVTMVRNGDINYQHALNTSGSLSPGVPVQGSDPLWQNRISIIVFTSLVCRAAMEGGLILFSNEKLCFVTGRKALELLPFRANTKFFLILFLSRKSMSPEVAYPLGDSHIEAAVNSNDTGELNALALAMYHDFIYRVHRLHANPNYSPAIQKCCDYIELSLERKIRIADLAALTGYTPAQYRKRFKSH